MVWLVNEQTIWVNKQRFCVGGSPHEGGSPQKDGSPKKFTFAAIYEDKITQKRQGKYHHPRLQQEYG